MKPGQASFAVNHWPDEMVFPHARDRCTLIMVVHPKCPCTRASLQELAKVMRYASQPGDAIVLAVRPNEVSAGFEHTDIWEQAAAIPGVDVRVDIGGTAARALGLFVSGATSVYDAGGRLLFSGGITSARGHAGDNAGSDAIIALLSGRTTGMRHTPVYGCSLFAPDVVCNSNCTGSEAETCCQ